jgi:hypothetical protein
MQNILQDKLHWPVPLVIDAEYGDSWHVDHDFFKEHPDLRSLKLDVNYSGIPINTTLTVSVTESPTKPVEETPKEDTSTGPGVHAGSFGDKVEVLPGYEELMRTQKPLEKLDQDGAPVPGPVEGPGKEEEKPSLLNDALFDSVESVGAAGTTEEKPEREKSTSSTIIYTIKDTTISSKRKMNEILLFLKNERNKSFYKGELKNLNLKTKSGDSLLVEDFKVREDSFYALVRFYGL